jgi:hypothetical protein
MSTPPRDGRTSADLAAGLEADAERLVRLEVELAKQELKEMAISNGIGIGMFAGAAILGSLALLVAIPVLIVVIVPAHWIAALAWVVLYGAAAAVLAVIGRSRMRLEAPPRTLATLRETKAWLLRQLNTRGR